MGFINRLFGRKEKQEDPTSGWPLPKGGTPEIALHGSGGVGSLGFGDPIEAAQALGKPTEFRRLDHSDYCELLYGPAGFQVDFDGGRFAFLAVFIEADSCDPDHPDFRHTVAELRLPSGEAVRLTSKSGRSDLEAAFGKPEGSDEDEDETVVSFQINGLCLECELHASTGCLKRLNLYPEGSN